MTLAEKTALRLIRLKLALLALVSKRKAAEAAFRLFCTPRQKALPTPAPVFDSGERLAFELNGMLVRGYRWNHPRKKKILIVHGFESTIRKFDSYISRFIEKGYEVLAFDAPAHGESDGREITLPLYVQMLSRIDDYYGPIGGFLAHSFGGLAVTLFLETIPHDAETKVVLIAPATESMRAVDDFFRFLHLDKKLRPVFDRLLFEKGGVWPDHYSIRRVMPLINAQVLWFHDRNDDVTPFEDALKVQQAAHPHLRFVTTEGLGHRRIYRDQAVQEQSIGFLT